MLLNSDPAGSGRILLSAYLPACFYSVALSFWRSVASFRRSTESQLTLPRFCRLARGLLLWVANFGSPTDSGGVAAAIQYLS